MSLSDELLADFEDEGMNVDGTERLNALATIEEEMESEPNADSSQPVSYEQSVKSVAKLFYSQKLADVMSNIELFSKTKRTSVSGPVELDPEYQVIVEANEITVEITDELGETLVPFICVVTCWLFSDIVLLPGYFAGSTFSCRLYACLTLDIGILTNELIILTADHLQQKYFLDIIFFGRVLY